MLSRAAAASACLILCAPCSPPKTAPSARNGADPPPPATPTAAWLEVAGRAAHTATLTTDGRVLVVGGCVVDGCSEATVSTAFVTAAGETTPAPELRNARDAHTATALGDGSVLVVGGFAAEGTPPLDEAEDLAPGAAAWRAVGRLEVPRGGHAAAALGEGHVLVAGGWVAPHTYTDTIEIFDAASESFTRGPSLPVAADGLAATTLDDGSVLVTGGQSRPGVASGQAVVISPDGVLRDVGPLMDARFKHTSVLLPTGEVLVIGGTVDDHRLLVSTEIFDPLSQTFRPGPVMTSGRYKLSGSAATLPDGRVAVAGGGAGAEVLDVERATSTPIPALRGVRSSFSTVNVVGQRLLVLGGYDANIALTGLNELLSLKNLT